MSVSTIRERLSDAHPVINRQVDDEVIPFTAAEREATLDEWAEFTYDRAMGALRRERDRLLAESDWTQQPDAPADTAAWAKYRQALRDLPAKTDDPEAVKWPKAPGAV